jgi:trimeric autotransporter adhesin
VLALAAMGDDLYVAGRFTDAADLPAADHIARWDGSAWSTLGSDPSGDGVLDGAVHALAVGAAGLYVGGDFTDLGGIPGAAYLALWDGTAWSAIAPHDPLNGPVTALATVGGDLYVGGDFTDAGGIPEADHLARWDGSAWSAVGGAPGS